MGPEALKSDMDNVLEQPKLTREAEVLRAREQFYVAAELGVVPIFCGDDRGPDEIYLQMFGGANGLVYTRAVLQETYKVGSVDSTLKAQVSYLIPKLVEVGLLPGVHSDVKSEQGHKLNDELQAGDVGCGYLAKRGFISLNLHENADQTISTAQRLRPELFLSPRNILFAREVTDAHGRLAERSGFMGDGRELLLAAHQKGAKMLIVDGEHVSETGVINTRSSTTLNTGAAIENELATYNEDAWAKRNAYRELPEEFAEYKEVHREIADTLDAIAVMRVLGVKDIAVRR